MGDKLRALVVSPRLLWAGHWRGFPAQGILWVPHEGSEVVLGSAPVVGLALLVEIFEVFERWISRHFVSWIK